VGHGRDGTTRTTVAEGDESEETCLYERWWFFLGAAFRPDRKTKPHLMGFFLVQPSVPTSGPNIVSMAPKRARSPTSKADREAARAAKAREKAEHDAAVAQRKAERAAKLEEKARAKAARQAVKDAREYERTYSIVENYLEEIVMKVAYDYLREQREKLGRR
jgi:hypothetical protein